MADRNDGSGKYMIVLENICKTYEIGGELVKALDHASLRVGDGEFVSIIGRREAENRR
ncbi:MAG: hypothetical protein NC347_04235 [Clostridium sp.]|nr:hypothetical protein [Clostridium sp.]